MKVRTFSSPRTAARALARHIARRVSLNPRLVLGLPTGRTSIPLYDELVALSRARAIDFSRVTTFNLDEFLGLPADDPRSYHAFMRQHLFDHVNLSPRRTHLLNGAARDVSVECARFERAIARAGGIDFMVLGLGGNGHIGFNEPAPSLQARTHRVTLLPSSREANAGFFGGDPAQVPAEAMTMGMGTILKSRRILLLVTGEEKAPTVAAMIRGAVTPQLPASFLQLHDEVEVICDADAASQIR